jgi:hypothetical protein
MPDNVNTVLSRYFSLDLHIQIEKSNTYWRGQFGEKRLSR